MPIASPPTWPPRWCPCLRAWAESVIDELRSVNPATEAVIEVFATDSAEELDRKLERSARTAVQMAATPLAERAALLLAVAAILRRDRDSHAAAITAEMGKTSQEARAEVEKCAFACEYFAASAARFLADEPAPSDSPNSHIRFEPLGVVLACMPWNF